MAFYYNFVAGAVVIIITIVIIIYDTAFIFNCHFRFRSIGDLKYKQVKPIYIFPHRFHLLYCAVLYCTMLCCIALYCNILHCTVLHCTVLYCAVSYCTTVLFLARCTGRNLRSKSSLQSPTLWPSISLKR